MVGGHEDGTGELREIAITEGRATMKDRRGLKRAITLALFYRGTEERQFYCGRWQGDRRPIGPGVRMTDVKIRAHLTSEASE